MKHLIVILSLLCLSGKAQTISQVEMFSDISGKPMFPKNFENVNGTPYLFDDWVMGKLTLKGDRTISGIRINLDLVADELHYMDEKGKIMIASTAFVKSFETPESGRHFVSSPASSFYYEVLVDGSAALLRHSKKVIVETKPYNSATIQKSFHQQDESFLSWNGTIKVVSTLDDILETLDSEELKQFAKAEKLKRKSENSWTRAVRQFNLLVAPQGQ